MRLLREQNIQATTKHMNTHNYKWVEMPIEVSKKSVTHSGRPTGKPVEI